MTQQRVCDPAVARLAGRHSFRIDEMTERLVDRIDSELVAADRRRSALVEALTLGPDCDGTTAWEVAHLLGMPYRGTFLVLVAETAAFGSEGMSGIENRLSAAGVASAWRVQPDFEIAVLSYARRRSATEVVELLRAHATTRVGVSSEFHQLEYTPRAMRYARVALELLSQGHCGVRQLKDSPLAELAMENLDTTRRVVQRVLGRVLSLPSEERTTLLDTAAAWLDARGSAREAGRVLFCHENTVRYRIHRLEAHMDRQLDDPTAIAELATAIVAVRMFPSLARIDRESDSLH